MSTAKPPFKRKGGLGSGLDQLLGSEPSSSAAREQGADQSLPIARLQPGKYQPRTRMNPESLAELAESIKAQGIMQPILVRPVAGGQYEIIAGERRFRASQLAGLTEVPVLIKDVPDEAALAMALIENIQREDLNPLEEAQGVQRLIREFSFTHEQAAQAIGRSRSATSNLLRLLGLAAPVQDMLMDGRLDMGHARALLGVDGATQIQLGQHIAAKGLSVREAEALVAKTHKAAAPSSSKAKAGKPDRDTRRLEEELSDALGAEVTLIPGSKGHGKVQIRYASFEQLDGIVARLKGS
ncbi:MAG TPA: ParB/RepB/Spo0J family partition protein [Burkholderiaceae bacterium]|nr:ParB/RepB/Spo0J family partition protein [Burkholderiaceae bacterium]